MSFDNAILDAAFSGKRHLSDDQMEAFENGRNLACWHVASIAIAILKDNDLGDFTAECLDADSFEQFLRKIRVANPGTYDLIDLDRRVAKDGYARALKIFQNVLIDAS